MASSFEVINGKLKITFWYQADTAKVQAIVEAASSLLYTDRGFENQYDGDGELIPWETLTNNQQLAVVDRYVREVIINTANEKNTSDAAKEAQEAVVPLSFDEE